MCIFLQDLMFPLVFSPSSRKLCFAFIENVCSQSIFVFAVKMSILQNIATPHVFSRRAVSLPSGGWRRGGTTRNKASHHKAAHRVTTRRTAKKPPDEGVARYLHTRYFGQGKHHLLQAALFLVLLTYCAAVLPAQIVPLPFHYGAERLSDAQNAFRRDLQQEAQRRLFAAKKNFPEAAATDNAALLLAEAQFRAAKQNPDEYTHGWRTLDSFALQHTNSPLLPFAFELAAKRYFERERFAEARETFARSSIAAEERLRSMPNASDSASRLPLTTLLAESYFWQAVCFTEELRYDSAEVYFTRLAKDFPTSEFADDAIFLNARFDELSRNFDGAIAGYERVAKEYPRGNVRIAAHLRAAQNHLQFRRSTRAISELEQAIAVLADVLNNPRSSYAEQSYVPDATVQMTYLRGEAYLAGKQYDAALKAFQNVIAAKGSSSLVMRARLGRGFALLQRADTSQSLIDSALNEYNTVLDADNDGTNPEFTRLAAMARLYRTVALKRKGDRETARKELSALAVQSDFQYSAQALLELGELYYAEGKHDEARKTLERAAREAPDLATQARVNLLLAENALEARQYALAIRAFERTEQNVRQTPVHQLTERDEILAEALLKRGVALAQAKEYREAITILTRFLNDYTEHDLRPEAAFWLVEAQFHADLLQNAEKGYQSFLTNYPSAERSEEALYGLGWTQFRLRRFSESAGIFTRLLREFPESRFALDVLVRKGDGLYLSKNYRAAADAYRQATRVQARNDAALTGSQKESAEQREYAAFQLGQSLYRLQEYDQAIAAMKNFAQQYKNSPLADDALYGAAWMLFQERKFEDAAREFTTLVEVYPLGSAAPRAYYALGDSYFNLTNYDAAIKAYRAVADIFPLSEYAADAVSAIQYAYILQGKDDSAATVADRYINANPGSTLAQEVKFKKAETLFNAGKFMNAASEYEDFIAKNRQNPRNAEALYQLGRSYASINDTTKAFDAFRRVQETYPQSNFAAPAALETAMLKLEQKKIAEADTLFVQIERLYPNDDAAVRAAFERANLRESRGDTTAAMLQYRTVADRYAGTDYGDRCRFRVAMFFRQNNLFDSSRAQFSRIATTRNDELGAEAQYRIGELFQREKRFPEAIEAFLKNKTTFAGLEDWQTLALLNAGACYEALKQFESAKEMYRLVTVRRSVETDDFGKTAQQRLEKLEKM
jgi:TolA-binding protein